MFMNLRQRDVNNGFSDKRPPQIQIACYQALWNFDFFPKKGDLTRCTNSRGISLFSIPGKVMATVILNRMRIAIDKKLRPNQAGFRSGRSCCEQIFTLRKIVDK